MLNFSSVLMLSFTLPTFSLSVISVAGTLMRSPVERVLGRVACTITGLVTFTSPWVLPCALPSVAITITRIVPMY